MTPFYGDPKKFHADFSDLLGKTFTKIKGDIGDGELLFFCEEGVFTLYHEQDCCESVYIEDITGDLFDLLNTPITLAEESISNENPIGVHKEYQESFTWTFYKLATIKGYVDIRWYGQSNGYYSERVSVMFTAKE